MLPSEIKQGTCRISYFSQSKAICFVLSFYTSHLSLEERALSKRAICFAFKMKERPGLAVLLMRQALLQRALPLYVFFFLNHFSSPLALATHVELDYPATSVNTQTAKMTPGHAGFVCA